MGYFRPISRYISETEQDGDRIVPTTKDKIYHSYIGAYALCPTVLFLMTFSEITDYLGNDGTR